MSDESEIYFPDTLPFPVTVRGLAVAAGAQVKSGHRLLNYSFVYRPTDPTGQPETRFGSWDATFEGELERWNIVVGEMITRERAKDRPALCIIEPCKHGMQFNGLCALCGIDVSNLDYSSRAESSRATIQMTHSASGPTVSLEEAQKLERETAEHLLSARKLSLIVDLDQTIVHATVDPTVGEWIADGEAWEERYKRVEQREKKLKEGEETDIRDVDEDIHEEDEVNPNWDALKDVKKFRLPPDNFGVPLYRWKDKTKDKGIQSEGCLYFVKPRPGWRDFLSRISKKYEMHVYTMGTRTYAEEVCAAIDPDGSLFGGRILSRDESGSLTQKSLRRLFPCDTSMVVIIDDRADVWEWSPNLVKVIPFDFFIGIGDINSTFLPKIGGSNVMEGMPTANKTSSELKALDSSCPTSDPSSISNPAVRDSVPDETIPSLSKAPQTTAKTDMIAQNALALEAQVEERPLAKKQEQLENDDGTKADEPVFVGNDGIRSQDETNLQSEHIKAKHSRKALLKNDDDELIRIGELLEKVHKRFYEAYDKRINDSNRKRRRISIAKQEVPYDVKLIIRDIRHETLKDVHILFSGIIPTNTEVEPEMTEIWRTAQAFGATCHKEIDTQVTHVVTSKRGTQKVEKARQAGGVFIVWLQWFTDSLAKWKRQDERHYLLDELSATPLPFNATASSSPSDPNVVLSDTDPGASDGDGHDSRSTVGILDEIPDSELQAIPAKVSGEIIELNGEGVLDLGEVDWEGMDDEVEAAMMESDSDLGESEDAQDSGDFGGHFLTREVVLIQDRRSGTESSRSAPHLERKRLRSANLSEHESVSDGLQSPPSKKKRMTAGCLGSSPSDAFVAEARLHGEDVGLSYFASANSGTPVTEYSSNDNDDDTDGESDEGEEIDDDFLVRELEKELG